MVSSWNNGLVADITSRDAHIRRYDKGLDAERSHTAHFSTITGYICKEVDFVRLTAEII